MIPNVSRGYSFKGLTDYLRHDKGERGEDRPDSAERVGFVEALNFEADPGEDLAKAAKFMAWTSAIREDLKAQAGIKPGGRAAEGPPVWHMSLSWGKGETVDRAEMERAAISALATVGLGPSKGHQTVFVQHTDTEHQHLHVVVNLVHPKTGRQANPFRDQPRLQAWGRDYEKARGAVLCHEREAKYAEIDRQRAQTATRSSFTEAAKGRPPQARRGEPGYQPTPDRFGRDRSTAREPRKPYLPRHEWEAQRQAQAAGRDADFQRTRAMTANRYAAMRSAERDGQHRRNAEYGRMREDRKAERDAIREKYEQAIAAVWNPEGGPKQASPDQLAHRQAWQRVSVQLDARRTIFEDRERSLLGRFRNARLLLGPKASLFAAARLAVNEGERRHLFERQQRREQARLAPPRAQAKQTPRPITPEPKYANAARLKAMRTAELAEHDRGTRAGFASMKSRHQFERTAEDAARHAYAAATKAAWDQFNEAHPKPQRADRTPANDRAAADIAVSNVDGRTADSQAEAAPEKAAEPKADRFGRSRNRQPRAPRAARGDRLTVRVSNPMEDTGKAENLPVEWVLASGGDNPTPESPEATHGPENGQDEAKKQRTADEQAEADRAALERLLQRTDAENAARDAERDGRQPDGGRERSRSP